MKTVRIFLPLLLFILSNSSFTIAQRQIIELFETEEIKAILEYEEDANITLDN